MSVKKAKNKKRKKKTSNYFRKLWDFLWNSNSIWSWIADIILLYIIVKFIFFPLLSLIFGTQLPSVIVESGSMEHKVTDGKLCGINFEKSGKVDFDEYWFACGKWYEKRNITKSQFKEWKYPNGIEVGDIIIVSGRWEDNLKICLLYTSPSPRD